MVNEEFIYSALDDIANFIDDIDVSAVGAIRIALSHVSEAVSPLAKYTNLSGSLFVDGIMRAYKPCFVGSIFRRRRIMRPLHTAHSGDFLFSNRFLEVP